MPWIKWLLCICALLVACAWSSSAFALQDEEQQSEPEAEATTQVVTGDGEVGVDEKPGDRQIEESLQEILEATVRYRNLSVEVRDGVVFLGGVASTDDDHALAADLAKRTEGVAAVVNNLADPIKPIWTLRPAIAEFEALLRVVVRSLPLLLAGLVLTGLRRGELASLTVGDLQLDTSPAYVTLSAASEKARRGADIPLRTDLAEDLRQWLSERLEPLRKYARLNADPLPARLPLNQPVFTVPRQLVKILDRDLKAAGIPKEDERGRTVDVHALRLTFGTLLSKG